MSVDPKFANLPWIAYDEPDVYETDDLPEADQRKSETNPAEQVLPKEIEQVSISASKARERFEHCKVDASNVDFSDKISGEPSSGYAIENSEYASGWDSEQQLTLVARFQRLQAEVRQLIDDAETVKKTAVASETKSDLTIEHISALASSLTNQLNQVHLEEIFGTDLDLSELCAHDALLQKRLFDQIANFKPKRGSQKGGKPCGSITFELYSKPSEKIDAANEKTLELDRRLQRLEALIGSREVTATGPGGLMDTAVRLSERLSLLQPNKLDQIEARLDSLREKLSKITSNPGNSSVPDADIQSKIAQLFEIVKKWSSFSADIPIVIDRLKDLQTLHEQASEFSASLVDVEVAQRRIEESLATYGLQLKSLQDSLSDALSTFKENALTLEKSIKAT